MSSVVGRRESVVGSRSSVVGSCKSVVGRRCRTGFQPANDLPTSKIPKWALPTTPKKFPSMEAAANDEADEELLNNSPPVEGCPLGRGGYSPPVEWSKYVLAKDFYTNLLV
jgi:hypothetical protein